LLTKRTHLEILVRMCVLSSATMELEVACGLAEAYVQQHKGQLRLVRWKDVIAYHNDLSIRTYLYMCQSWNNPGTSRGLEAATCLQSLFQKSFCHTHVCAQVWHTLLGWRVLCDVGDHRISLRSAPPSYPIYCPLGADEVYTVTIEVYLIWVAQQQLI
jgi:hypothetical protein